jgi:hypothetical protein
VATTVDDGRRRNTRLAAGELMSRTSTPHQDTDAGDAIDLSTPMTAPIMPIADAE